MRRRTASTADSAMGGPLLVHQAASWQRAHLAAQLLVGFGALLALGCAGPKAVQEAVRPSKIEEPAAMTLAYGGKLMEEHPDAASDTAAVLSPLTEPPDMPVVEGYEYDKKLHLHTCLDRYRCTNTVRAIMRTSGKGVVDIELVSTNWVSGGPREDEICRNNASQIERCMNALAKTVLAPEPFFDTWFFTAISP